MNNTSSFTLFSELRNKNIQTERIIELLAQSTKINNNIEEIKQHGKNLLITSCLYDNDNAFKFFAETFNAEFKDSFKECIKFVYPNKNPTILKTSFEYLPPISDNEKIDFLKMFANNCYRQENIEISQDWLKNNLNEEQLDIFITELFRLNNKPFLRYISKINFWKSLIKKHPPTQNQSEQFFYKELISEPITLFEIDINQSSEITQNNDPLIKEEPRILKKRKKTPLTNIS